MTSLNCHSGSISFAFSSALRFCRGSLDARATVSVFSLTSRGAFDVAGAPFLEARPSEVTSTLAVALGFFLGSLLARATVELSFFEDTDCSALASAGLAFGSALAFGLAFALAFALAFGLALGLASVSTLVLVTSGLLPSVATAGFGLVARRLRFGLASVSAASVDAVSALGLLSTAFASVSLAAGAFSSVLAAAGRLRRFGAALGLASSVGAACGALSSVGFTVASEAVSTAC